jgi:hypothetical protein
LKESNNSRTQKLGLCWEQLNLMLEQLATHINTNDYKHTNQSPQEPHKWMATSTSRNVIVSWHDNLTQSDQNDTNSCHFGRFMLDCNVTKLPNFYY